MIVYGAERWSWSHVTAIVGAAFVDSKNFLRLLKQLVIYLATILERCIWLSYVSEVRISL